jgi:hypothetical protein
MFCDQLIKSSPVEHGKKLTKKARTTYHDPVLLFGVLLTSYKIYDAPWGGRFQPVSPKTVFGQECCETKYIHEVLFAPSTPDGKELHPSDVPGISHF